MNPRTKRPDFQAYALWRLMVATVTGVWWTLREWAGFLPSRFSSSRRREQELRKLFLTSDLFDADYYATQYPDALTEQNDPALHYIRRGANKGYNPSARFDANFYLERNGDVRAARINPLEHYLRHGEAERREIRGSETAVRAKAPPEAAWGDIAARMGARPANAPTIDVVIPIYRGFDETANCLFTVLQSKFVISTDFEVVAIDDAGPEPELSALLDRLAALKLITLRRNENNVGFVASVNRGMELHADRDVILLNSDTEVYGDWLDRLRAAAYSKSDIGTVTPLSNNATICSYPRFAGEFDGSFEAQFEEIDRLAASANKGQIVDIPTAVGFCMYVRRQCINEVGLFDVETFKRGYGEENDFSKRIAARGWRNVLTGDVFVRHLGRVSFQGSSAKRVNEAVAIINRLYPGYNREIATYIQNDPPRNLRRNLDMARLRHAGGKKNVLFILHNLGGGTTRHVKELVEQLGKEGIGAYLMQPDVDLGFARLSHSGVRSLSGMARLDIKHGLNDALALFRELGIAHIHIHHLIGFSSEIHRFIQLIAQNLGVAYDVTLHDYFAVCPRIDMIDESGVYCDNSDLHVCETCIRQNGSANEIKKQDVSVWFWHETWRPFVEGARKVFVPDENTKAHMLRFWPDLALTVRPHPETVPDAFDPPLARKPDEALRVAVIGGISRRKGSAVLLRCAEDALARNLPIKFVILGFPDSKEFNRLSNVDISGSYKDSKLRALLKQARCHIAFFPAVWPETYSYTLSSAIYSGLFPIAFDIGAIARRMRGMKWGRVLSFDMYSDAGRINDELLATQRTEWPPDWHPVAGRSSYPSILADYYEFDWTARDSRNTTAANA